MTDNTTPAPIPELAVRLVKQFEGFRASAYRCPAGIWTAGFGSTRGKDGKPIQPGTTLTEAQAEALLLRDMQDSADAIAHMVTVELTEVERCALISLVYNIGRRAFSQSTLLKLLNEGDYNGAVNQFARWNKGGGKVLPGLVTRRQLEARVFAGIA